MNFVVLCGGSGSRLWPKSREKYPKQFLKLNNDYTMLQNTLIRIKNLIIKIKSLPEFDNEILYKIYIVCNKDHVFIVEEQIKDLNINENIFIISEPKGRDSAPAICIMSLLDNEDTNTFIMPCDHIFNDDHFIECSINGLNYINDSIVTFGIKPTSPETCYGYIKIGNNNITEKFIEKPTYNIAKEYFESGNYLWNAGIFIFKNKNIIECYNKYSNDILTVCKNTIEDSKYSNNILNLSIKYFIDCRAISVDYAIMEYLTRDINKNINAKTILYNSSWNDIGSYTALYNELDKDINNNVLKGDIYAINSKNSYIDTEDVFTSIIGIDNLIVVNTKDSLLICNNNNTQNVKNVVDYLKKNNREEAFLHKKVIRPWGYYINIEGNNYNGHKVKNIVVNPNKRLSLQSHSKRSEHWVIVEGKAKVQLGFDFIILNKDEHIYIPINTLHRIENIGDSKLEFIETQIGTYLGEDDIIRYEDDFGRI
jgi:mannose-1-phosphate guanylyltransferase/mannose-6-phosphate isomerase